MQDLPPPGGFPSIRYHRNIPSRGPSGLTILIATTAICSYGFYRVIQGRRERLYFRLIVILIVNWSGRRYGQGYF